MYDDFFDGQMALDHLDDVGLTDCADLLLDDLATLEKQQCGNAADVVAHRGSAVLVHVQFADLYLAGDIRSRRRPRWASSCGTVRTIPPRSPLKRGLRISTRPCRTRHP